MGVSGRLTFPAVGRSELDPQHRRYPNSHSCQVYDLGRLPYLDGCELRAVSGYTAVK